MPIKRVLEKAEAEQLINKGDKTIDLLNEIVKTLQSNEGKYVEIDITDVKPLRNKLAHMSRIGTLSYDYQHLKIITAKSDNNNSIAFVRWTEQTEKKVTKKRKEKVIKSDENPQPVLQSN
jgi:hypothetical protein